MRHLPVAGELRKFTSRKCAACEETFNYVVVVPVTKELLSLFILATTLHVNGNAKARLKLKVLALQFETFVIL